jgi:hypothetical protein
MSELIREVILTTRRADGSTHIAPMGVRTRADEILIAPFRPSGTLRNLMRERTAVVNLSDDVRLFAGCLTGRHDWPLVPAQHIDCHRLRDAIAHQEIEVKRVEDDPQRPRLFCRVVHAASHRPFEGLNRARAAVLELAILVSRLEMLPAAKLEREMDYLRIAMEKTAGPAEREAWSWLEERVMAHRQEKCA